MYNTPPRGRAHAAHRAVLGFAPRAGRRRHAASEPKRAVREVVGVDPAYRRVVQAVAAHRGAAARPGGRVPGRARAATHRRRVDRAGATGEPRDTAGQAPAPRRGRPAGAWRAKPSAVLGSPAAVDRDGGCGARPPGAAGTSRRAGLGAGRRLSKSVVRTVESAPGDLADWHLRAEAHAAREVGTPSMPGLDATSTVSSRSPSTRTASPSPIPTRCRRPRQALPGRRRQRDPGRRSRSTSVHQGDPLHLPPDPARRGAHPRRAARRGGRRAIDVRTSTLHSPRAARRTATVAQHRPAGSWCGRWRPPGRRLQLALAPAGTGKTTAMAVALRCLADLRRARRRPGPLGCRRSAARATPHHHRDPRPAGAPER